MTGINELMATAMYIAEVFGCDADLAPVFAKGDHQQAYKQWPAIHSTINGASETNGTK